MYSSEFFQNFFQVFGMLILKNWLFRRVSRLCLSEMGRDIRRLPALVGDFRVHLYFTFIRKICVWRLKVLNKSCLAINKVCQTWKIPSVGPMGPELGPKTSFTDDRLWPGPRVTSRPSRDRFQNFRLRPSRKDNITSAVKCLLQGPKRVWKLG